MAIDANTVRRVGRLARIRIADGYRAADRLLVVRRSRILCHAGDRRTADRGWAVDRLRAGINEAIAAMLDPAECGPAFLALPQDTQELAFDYPAAFFDPRVWRIPRPRADRQSVADAAAVLKTAKKPLIIAGGGVRYSLAETAVAAFAIKHGIPVVETIAGKGGLTHIPRMIELARQAGKPVLIDMWATWCKNCLTMDKTTLADPRVKAALSGYVKIKFQAEDPDTPAVKDVMQRFSAVGLPAYGIVKAR